MVKSMIQSQNVHYSYTEHKESLAIDGLDLHVKDGEFVVIIGHNGSGKSTFAKLCNGIMMPTEGTLLIDNMSISDEKLLWDIRKTAGMVFQNPDNQLVATVVDEDVAFWARKFRS